MYVDIEENIKDFFRASIDRTLDDFDFESAFDTMKDRINAKLAEHGLTTEEDFISFYEDCMCVDKSELSSYTTDTNYIRTSTEELHEVLMHYLFEKSKKTFGSMGAFKELLALVDKLDNAGELSTSEKAILYDEVIHAQHETGDIFEEVDIEAIKEEIDREYDCTICN